MGVSGSGKSTIGKILAKKLNIPYEDADDFHPKVNVEKMSHGTALTDADRQPWLENLSTLLADHQETGLVLACSALKASYRTILNSKLTVPATIVYLRGTYKLIYERMQKRNDHFMSPKLLQSQFKSLEEPDHAITISVNQTIDEIITEVLDHLA